MLVDAAKQGDVEIPYFCYEPKLGQPVGACRMCLVEIEGIPKLQTSCSTPVKDGMVVHTQTERVRHAQNADRRVPARQPPARLPGVRQGRRVPAAGHHLRLGPGPQPLHRAQAPLREAAGAVAAGRDRPRALHPLLPLRALLPGDRRGLPADLHRARRPHLRRHPRRPPLRGAVQRQHHRAVPGGRADLAALPVPRPPVGHRGRRPASARCARRSATSPSPSATSASCACSPATTTAGVDDGWLCDKGRFAYQAIHVDERITRPLVRDGGELREVSWERALQTAAGLARHQGRVGTLVGGQASNEEGFLLQRLPREALDSSDIDSRGPQPAARRRGPDAGRAGAPGLRRPTSSSPTPCWCSAATRATTRRSSTCGSARACAATASSWPSPPRGRPRWRPTPPPASATRPAPRPSSPPRSSARWTAPPTSPRTSAAWPRCCATAARTW